MWRRKKLRTACTVSHVGNDTTHSTAYPSKKGASILHVSVPVPLSDYYQNVFRLSYLHDPTIIKRRYWKERLVHVPSDVVS